jgi:hypothetical protein
MGIFDSILKRGITSHSSIGDFLSKKKPVAPQMMTPMPQEQMMTPMPEEQMMTPMPESQRMNANPIQQQPINANPIKKPSLPPFIPQTNTFQQTMDNFAASQKKDDEIMAEAKAKLDDGTRRSLDQKAAE